jgi:hypothetical protein
LVLTQTASTFSTNSLSNGDLVYAVLTSNQACSIGSPASSNSLSTSLIPLPTLSFSSIALCPESTYLITKTTSVPVDNGWSITGANTVNNGYVTAGTNQGSFIVSYTDGCAQTVSATVGVASTSNLPVISDGKISFKLNNSNPQPQGPTASLYTGYNGTNYYSSTRPASTGYYRANNVSANNAGCPYPFYIFRCSTCPD